MKPWEETWDTYITSPDGLTIFVKGDAGDAPDVGVIHDGERARLATQAPAMARLLLALRLDFPEHMLHREKIDALLRAAGVLP